MGGRNGFLARPVEASAPPKPGPTQRTLMLWGSNIRRGTLTWGLRALYDLA
jgi:hypothetical protein